jgi:hypothetical protein
MRTLHALALRHPRRLVPILAATLVMLAATAGAAPPVRPPLAYWAFNCFTTCGDTNFQPESDGTAAASMSSTFEPDAGVNEGGTRLNALGFHEARSALTLRTGTGGVNNGRDLTWRVNATSASALRVSFATRRSPGGFAANQFQYSADGVTFVDLGAPFDPGADWNVVSFDLKHVRALNAAPAAAFRIVFNGGSTSSATEYALLDNLQVNGR